MAGENDHFEVYRRNGADSGFFGRGRIIRRLSKQRFDLGILMPNSFSSGWLFWRAGVARRLGTTYGGRKFMITDSFTPQMEGNRRVPRSMVEHYFDMMEQFGIRRGDMRLELFETDDPVALSRYFLAWSDLVDLKVVPVVDDEEIAKALTE